MYQELSLEDYISWDVQHLSKLLTDALQLLEACELLLTQARAQHIGLWAENVHVLLASFNFLLYEWPAEDYSTTKRGIASLKEDDLFVLVNRRIVWGALRIISLLSGSKETSVTRQTGNSIFWPKDALTHWSFNSELLAPSKLEISVNDISTWDDCRLCQPRKLPHLVVVKVGNRSDTVRAQHVQHFERYVLFCDNYVWLDQLYLLV